MTTSVIHPAIAPFLFAVGASCLLLILLVVGWDMWVEWWQTTRVYRWWEFRQAVGKQGRRG